MISIKVLSKQLEKFVLDNAPSILTGVGAIGSVGAVFMTGKASFQAARMIEVEKVERWRMDPTSHPVTIKDLERKDKILLVWKEYIPAASLLTLSVASIVCSNRVSTKRAAALAAAYSLSEKAYSEYREKVVEKFNANKERQIRDEIAQDKIRDNPPNDSQIIITGNGDVICYDLPTGRYFHSNMEKLRSVQNDINAAVNEIGFATLSDFYVALGLKETPYSEELGWTTSKMLDLHFSAALTDDNQPCMSINYTCDPIRNLAGTGGCSADPPF